MEYSIVRSRRRTLAIEITRDAQVVVRVPFLATNREIERFVQDHAQWIARGLARRLANPPVNYTAEQMEQLKRRARAVIPDRVAHYSAQMGLVPTGITINSARTRFGSCGTTNRLNFSCLLMNYPLEAIDYVVVHELAHLRHRNHGREFYALIERYLPDYRERERLLKEKVPK